MNTGKGKLLKPSEVAERLGVDSGTVSRYIREKRLPAIYTAGGHHRVYEVDVDAFLARAERPRDVGAIIIAVINQKGGVGKTTATANLGVLIHEIGLRALVVDLDPQGSPTWSMGYQPDAVRHTIFDAIKGEPDIPMTDLILTTEAGPDLAPNNIMATQADRVLFGKVTWGTRLAHLLDEVRKSYDYILLDCAPNLNSLTVNALHAADYVVVPTHLEMLSVNGLRELLQRIEEARREANARLRVAGVVAMMVQHANSNREVEHILHDGLAEWGIPVFHTVIKRSTQYGSIANRQGVMAAMNPRGEHTQAYRHLLAELLQMVGGPGVERISMLENVSITTATATSTKGNDKDTVQSSAGGTVSDADPTGTTGKVSATVATSVSARSLGGTR
ncbi:MAG: AAA family ATPase [Chloroflexota bacterium]|nr:AAA family ATPase [Chloroflexota bacterium]